MIKGEKMTKNNSKIWLRKFKEEDLDFILSKFSYFFKIQTKEFVAPILNTWINGKSEGYLQFARCIMCDKQPIGIISLGEKEKGIASFAMAILEDYRGNGFGTVSFNLATSELKDLGIKKIKSSCSYDNNASKMLHKKLGFKLKKTETNLAGNKMNRYELEL